jgi:TRAP-type mannitol/chloroaromatic compound transport system permease small subunit
MGSRVSELAGAAPPAPPGSAFGWLVRICNTAASLWIVVLMVLVIVDVAGRAVFNKPLAGVNEIMEISIVAMLYLQVTQALRDGKHTRSDAFIGQLHARRPVAAHALESVFCAAGATMMVLVLRAAWPRLVEAWNGGFTIGNQGVFLVPEWPLRAVIVFGCVLMSVQFVLLAVRHAGRCRQAS